MNEVAFLSIDQILSIHFHLCNNHPFVDGNKRTSLAAAEMFLLTNEVELEATNDELEALTLSVADGTAEKEEVMAFFEEHTE